MTSFNHVIWPRLILGMLLTAIIALSVHVVLLEVLHVPYPSGYPSNGWMSYLNSTVGVLAIIYFYDLARPRFERLSGPLRCLALFVLVAMLRESLIRQPLMEGVTTTVWIYPIIKNLPRLIQILLVCCLVVPTAPLLHRWWQKLIAALLFYAFVFFVCKPLIDAGFKHLLDSISAWDHDEIYSLPYPWQVTVPAYLSFAEPVVACFVIAALVLDRLAEEPMARICWFTLLILLVRAALFPPLIYVFYAKTNALSALLSMGQFSLEEFVLALLTAVTWRFCQKPVLEAGRSEELSAT